MLTYIPTPSYLPPMVNGAMSLANEGFDIEILCFTGDSQAVRTEEASRHVTITRIVSRSLRFFHMRYGLSPKHTIMAAIQYAATYSEFNFKVIVRAFRTNADIYEAHDLPALLPAYVAASLRRKPLAYHAHELYAEMHERVRFASFWKLLDRLIVPRADVVVTPEENRSRIMFEEYRAKEMPLTVRNCPPYTPPIRSNKLREALGPLGHESKTIVLYQGLFDDARCMTEMIEAAKFFDDNIILVLIGSGFNKWSAPEKTIGNSDRVVFLPRVAYSELNLYTASADIGFLFYRNNCRNNYFCAPNKVHEYMMMGLPVITNNYPGIAALVAGEGVGLCVDSEDPKAIAGAVNAIARDPAMHERMKQTALRLSKSVYNWEREFKKLKDKYFQILGLVQSPLYHTAPPEGQAEPGRIA